MADGRWEPWPPAEVARRLRRVTAPWCVAGGWALDLWHGRETRAHEDIEIAVPEGAFDQVRAALAGFELAPPGGRTWQESHQTWVRDPHSGAFVLDVFREPHDGDTWISRRDAALRLPYRDIIRTSADGVPYLVPELVLLFKAKGARDKDTADLELALPALPADRRRWLHEHLPDGHAWRDITRAGLPG
ncbi:hypothetical protein ABT297_38895 [Dactylosporangium sp. NPDC000555]|uniref:nucleotidyltransferase domain-containing protein n=1 Tax=Dactylosporangium sp. NPDC000555 TaxID=3154260 RepID=UPI003323DF6E